MFFWVAAYSDYEVMTDISNSDWNVGAWDLDATTLLPAKYERAELSELWERPFFVGLTLSTPEVVELLKYPTAIGTGRRQLLDYLERRYDRRFDTQWDFVAYAEAENLGLDFTSPPKRPDPRAILKEIREILLEAQARETEALGR